MKQIIALIRDERVEETKTALEVVGVRGVTFLHVTGRGQQRGKVSARELGGSLTRNMRLQLAEVRSDRDDSACSQDMEFASPDPDKEFAFGFLPKRMLIMVSDDDQVEHIVQAIVSVNQSGRHGDGRIFICPMISAIRVRTGEQGEKALL